MEEIVWVVDIPLCHLMGIKQKFHEMIWAKQIDNTIRPFMLPKMKMKHISGRKWGLYLDGDLFGIYSEKITGDDLELKFTPFKITDNDTKN